MLTDAKNKAIKIGMLYIIYLKVAEVIINIDLQIFQQDDMKIEIG
jgi:hypothetical protein